jgi:hypothetical protein
MRFKPRNIRALAEMVVGNVAHFPYRSSSYITEFFQECDLEFVHDGSTRWAWTATRLEELLAEPQPTAYTFPTRFMTLLRTLMDKADAQEDDPDRSKALAALNEPLKREGFEAYFGEDDSLHVRHVATKTISTPTNPHRPLTPAETKRREQLRAAVVAADGARGFARPLSERCCAGGLVITSIPNSAAHEVPTAAPASIPSPADHWH